MSGNAPRTELLSPAGDWDALRAACANGADAVYFGLSNFNARHRAANFTVEELPAIVEYLHRRNVRGYVTCNTLIFSDELEQMARMLAAIAEAGADAVIVQDLGVAKLAASVAPGLPVHGSTQMTLTEPRGLEFVRSLGVERAILARELSLKDIEAITSTATLPVEVFVHGALCVAYSGQCLTSEALGGRSANRGQCAQACRLPYELIVDGTKRDLGETAYLLSPQDLAAYDHIDSLVKLGVASLKIEGRLKSAQYVAATTNTYRKALDAANEAKPFELSHAGRIDLEQSFSRGFSHGFLDGVNHQVLVQGRFPKSRGVRVGTVVAVSGARVVVELAEGHEPDVVKPGDGLVFDEGHPEQDEQGGRVYGVQPFEWNGTRRVEIEFARGAVNVAALASGTIVWRTDDPQFRKRMDRSFADESAAKRRELHAVVSGKVGGELSLRLRDGRHEAVALWPGPVQQALKHAATAESLREQLDRLGETPYSLGEVTLQASEPLMIPKSVLNDLRRRAIVMLDEFLRTGEKRTTNVDALSDLRQDVKSRDVNARQTPQLVVLARTMDQLDAVLAWQPSQGLARPAMVYVDFEDVRRYRDAVHRARAAEMPIGVASLRVIKPGEEGWLRQIANSDTDAVLIRNLATLAFFREQQPETKLIGDYSLNVANELTADLMRSHGLARLVPSYDLNWEQLQALVSRIDPGLFEVVIHQHMPMFHMEHCVFAHTLSNGKDHRDCGRPCDVHRVELRDRVGAAFPLVADAGCRNTVYNAVAQSAAEYVSRMLGLGLRWFRVELLREGSAEVGPHLEKYSRVLAGLDDGRDAWRGLQVLNQLGVTRGTFQLS
jgi:putative protease